MEEEKQFLIFAFLNDNHLSNVRTLQSIYTQDYSDIYLIVCNDCTDAFQCERFLYNLEARKGKNIQGIYLHENRYPIGELKTLRGLWKITDADYMLILHSGEYFTGTDVLSKCVQAMEDDSSAAVVSMDVELWSDDMKRCLSRYNILNNGKCNSHMAYEEKKSYRDCMFVYRREMIEKCFFSYTGEELSQTWILELLRTGLGISVQNFSCCKYSASSIKNAEVLVTQIFGNDRLKNIANKLKVKSEAGS